MRQGCVLGSFQGFFDFIATAEDDGEFTVRVYFNALDHLPDDGVIILIAILFPLLDHLLDLLETLLPGHIIG